MSDVLRVLRRRWPFAAVLLLLVGGLCYGALQVVPPRYEATSAVALIPPQSVETPNGNRFLLLGGLTPGRDVLLRRLVSDQTRRSVLRGSVGGDYKVEPDFTTSAPILLITASGPTPAVSSRVLTRMLVQLPDTLTGLQDELQTPASVRITSLTVSQETTPRRVGKNQIRAAIAAGGVGAVVGILALVGLDGVLIRRRKKAAVSDTATEEDEPLDETPEASLPADAEVTRRSSRGRGALVRNDRAGVAPPPMKVASPSTNTSKRRRRSRVR
ncbi:MAG: hypothetical protein JWO46_3119 [Nocardioidaceae bacterium]|nr:hypothetical protein [Nocardioidaceae bacterium]